MDSGSPLRSGRNDGRTSGRNDGRTSGRNDGITSGRHSLLVIPARRHSRERGNPGRKRTATEAAATFRHSRAHIPSFPRTREPRPKTYCRRTRSLTSVIPANAGTQAENGPPPKPRPIRTRTHAWIPASPCPERAQSSRAARPPDVGRLVGRSNPRRGTPSPSFPRTREPRPKTYTHRSRGRSVLAPTHGFRLSASLRPE